MWNILEVPQKLRNIKDVQRLYKQKFIIFQESYLVDNFNMNLLQMNKFIRKI